jgi:hypothetical protein
MSYKLTKENETITVYKNGKVASKGFMTEEDALHSGMVFRGQSIRPLLCY